MKEKLTGAILVLVFLGIASGSWGQEEKVAVSAGLGTFNRYVFRGYEIGQDSVVFQPYLGAAYRELSEAKREINGKSYNPNGYIDEVWTLGVNLKFSN
jgi:hypothetical protein